MSEWTDALGSWASLDRTPWGVSGPSPQRLWTAFVTVFANVWPSLSHSSVETPEAAPETIRPCFWRLGSRAVAARLELA